jgi:sugar lactone lactonase YvrE
MRLQWLKRIVVLSALMLSGTTVRAETLYSCMYHQSVTGGVRLYNTASGGFLQSLGTELGQIQGIAFAPNGDIYVSDGFNNKITRYNANGQLIGTLVHDPNKVNMDGTQGLAFGPDGMLYVGSFWNSRILKYHPTTGAFLGIFFQGGVFDKPMNMVFRPDGILYVACYHGGVLRFNASTGAQMTKIATEVLQGNSLLFDGDVMYVSDFHQDRIYRYDTPNSFGVPVLANLPEMDGPGGIALDSERRLYVACFWSRKILRFNLGTLQLVDTLATGDNFFAPTTLAFNRPAAPATATVSGIITLESSQNSAQLLTFEFRPRPTGTAFTRTQTLSNGGAFGFNDIPLGDYDVAIKGTKWLRKIVRVNASAGDVTNVAVTLKAGDITNDNVVDITDLLTLIAHYNAVSPSSNYLDAADLDNNGSNDIGDLLLLISRYNHIGE